MAFAFVQGKTGVGTVATLSVLFDSNVTAGNLLVVVGGEDTAAVFKAPVDTLGTVWVRAIETPALGSSHFIVYYGIARATGACTITLKINTAVDFHLHVREYSFSAAAKGVYVDATGTTVQATGTANKVGTGSRLQAAGELSLAAFYQATSAGAANFTLGANYLNGLETDGAGVDTMFTENRVSTPAGAVEVAPATSSVADAYDALIVCFAERTIMAPITKMAIQQRMN